jgi:hypothetical protein
MSQCSYNNNTTTYIVVTAVIIGLLFVVESTKNNTEHFGFFNVKKFMKKNGPGKLVGKIFGKLKTIFKTVAKGVAKVFKKIAKTFSKLISKGVKSVFKKLKDMIKKTIKKLASKLKPFLTILGAGLFCSAAAIFAGCYYYWMYLSPTTINQDINNLELDNMGNMSDAGLAQTYAQ